MAQDFDAAFVGSGHNALACALHLASKGWRVGVFEQAPELGGAVKSGEYTLPGFRHDWGAMNLSLFAGSSFHKRHGAELARHGLAFVPVAHPFSSAFPDGRWLGVSTDLEATVARFAAFSERDATTWRRLVAAFPDDAQAIFALLGSPMTMRALASFTWKTVRSRRLSGTLDLVRLLLSSPRRWLSDSFETPEIRAMLGAWGMHLDFAPDVAGGALFPYLEGMAGQAFGMALGKGGADTVTRALVGAIRARGGHVEAGASVARILHDGSRATGLDLVDDRRINATRAVVAGVAPRALLRLTGGTTPEFDQGMQDYAHAPGTMMIHLAMDDLPAWQAPELRQFAYVHLAPSLDQMAATYQQAQAGLLPAEPILVIGQPTTVDPSRAPDGKHVLWLQVRMVPGIIRGDAKAEIVATDWAQAAQPMASRALDLLEFYAPGTRARILAQRIVTPTELEADNPNLVGGDQVTGSHHLSQHFLFRPLRGHADGSTPLANLFLTG
ncbi:MAG TPA: NAD(P)/FAD-dependent oxidoreductase, partial [Rubellimicrobium sp.]|nr:NAD(P)/FAD-dependent oxidoreductase [Rubellimicrobium sp.]